MLLHALSSFIIRDLPLQALRVVVVLLLASVRAGTLGRSLVVLDSALAVVGLSGLGRLGAGSGWWWLSGRLDGGRARLCGRLGRGGGLAGRRRNGGSLGGRDGAGRRGAGARAWLGECGSDVSPADVAL